MRAPFLLCLSLALGCGRSAGRAGANDSLPPAGGPGIAGVILERTACFGSCPDYRVTLRGDGRASYHGGRFATRQGEFQAMLPPAEFTRITQRLAERGFFAMDTAYIQNVTDLPTFTLIADTTGGSHAVRCYGFGCPAAFHQLTALVDTVADQLAWDTLPPGP